MEIHGTVYTGKDSRNSVKLPPYVHNHGVLRTPQVRKLLRESVVGIFVNVLFLRNKSKERVQ